MLFLSIALFIVGMCIELAGLLGAGMTYTWIGIVVTMLGGIIWGLMPSKGTTTE